MHVKHQWYKPYYDVSWRQVGSDILLMKDVHDHAHSLAGTGVEIWNRIIVQAQSVSDTAKKLSEKYGLSNCNEILSDICTFFDELEAREFVRPCKTAPGGNLPEFKSKGGEANEME